MTQNHSGLSFSKINWYVWKSRIIGRAPSKSKKVMIGGRGRRVETVIG